MEVKVSLDSVEYTRKPSGDIIKINNRIAGNSTMLEIKQLALRIGEKGQSFCPTVFLNGERKGENFKEMQLFAVDFDSGVTYEEVSDRAEEYELPIAFAYNTFSSTDKLPKFRVVFLNDVPVTNRKAAEIMIEMLLKIFEEADSCCKDVARVFFGGKGLIGEIKEDPINIIKLTESFHRAIFTKEGGHYSRTIQLFAKRHNLQCINNCLHIDCVHGDGKDGENFDSHQYIYTSNAVFSPYFRKYRISIGYQPNVRINERKPSVRVSKSQIESGCRLYRDFLKLPHIHHNERFLLLTNMLYIKGGCKIFLNVINKKGYDNNKWRFYAYYAKNQGYHPCGCDGACPYADTCNHKANMVLTLKARERYIKKTGREEYYAVEDVYEYIYKSLEDAINQGSKGIYLIPAQTAIGKTEAYCSMISRYEHKRFIVAVPTNQLKREVENRLKSHGIIDILVTPSLDETELPGGLKGEIERLYQQGLGRNVTEVLKKFVKESKDSEDPKVINAAEWCKKYLRVEKELPNKRVLVTTHARLVTLAEDIIANRQVIIDEDILSTFFKNIREVSISAIQKALHIKSIPASLEERLRRILAAVDERYEHFNGDCDYGCIPKEELEKENISEDINDIAFASTFQKDNEYVRYFYPQMMRRGKYIVLSATIEESLYRWYFQGWWMKSYPYRRAGYKGGLVQRTAYSMSRQSIKNHKEKLMEFVKQYHQEYNIITFQCFEEDFNSCGLHFGNTEGVDRLKGKNILIIGTPHQNEFVYKLIGCHLGMEVNGDVLSERRISYGEYEFVLMTYKGEELRNLQIYFIRKELEQSIGRARLLREDCKVVVLSNFPCEQAELDQEDYLEVTEPEEEDACGPDMAGKL